MRESRNFFVGGGCPRDNFILFFSGGGGPRDIFFLRGRVQGLYLEFYYVNFINLNPPRGGGGVRTLRPPLRLSRSVHQVKSITNIKGDHEKETLEKNGATDWFNNSI